MREHRSSDQAAVLEKSEFRARLVLNFRAKKYASALAPLSLG
jgi:hypothetical protein